MPAEIKYNDKVIASVSPGQTATVNVKGSIPQSQIVVDLSKVGGDRYEEGFGEGYDEGIEAGKKAEYDAFWDTFQQNGTRDWYNYAFSVIWDDINFKPKYDIMPSDAAGLFFKSGITSLTTLLENAGVVLDLSNCTNVSSLFADCVSLTEVPHINLSKGSYCGSIFSWCIKLRKAELTFSEAVTNFDNAFYRCDSLETLIIHGTIANNISFANSANLQNASVQSVIDALKNLTGAAAKTLTLHATVGGNLTDEQKAAITAKNWQLVY